MKAVVLHEYGGPEKLKYEDWEDPVAADNDVLVRVTAASINPIDWKIRSGAMKDFFPTDFPAILGYDFSGVVRAVGKKVTGYAAGDKVFGRAPKCYAEFLLAELPGMTKLPEGLDHVEAAALPVVVGTGEQLISQAAQVNKGQTVLVTGALGAVGRTAVWVAKKSGATVIAGVRSRQKDEAVELGADAVLAIDDKTELEKLGFVDAVADTVGGALAETLMGKVKPGGRYGSVVGPPANAKLHPTITVVAFGSKPDGATLQTLASEIVAGKFRIPIDRMIPLSEAAKGHAAAEKGGVGKVLLLA